MIPMFPLARALAWLACSFSMLLAGAAWAGSARPAQMALSDLYGKKCRTLDTSARGSTRRCAGVGGCALMIYEDDDRTSVDIVAPNKSLYPLSYWDVVTLGYAAVGQKAEWRVGTRPGRKGRPVPTALLVRLNLLDQRHPGELIAVARIDPDGACVVYKADLAEPGAELAARKAAADPASKCLGPYTAD